MAQRGGGGHGGGGGGGVRGGGGGGFRGGGGGGGGFRGGGGGGFVGGGSGFVGNFGRGGFVGNYLRGGYGYGYGRGYGYGGYGGGYYPWGLGYGLGYWPDYGYYDYGYPYYDSYAYPAYQSSPNVTVVYPSQGQPNYYSQTARPVSHAYDEYGQEVNPAPANSGTAPSGSASSAAASPIYLIAMKDGVIRAAASYWVNGQTLHYVTMEHLEKQVPLSEIDRGLSQQLNRERRVQFQLPQ